ncbi:hypothetical protein GCM10023144_00800 [Pigmentiphaga soli]|uniref:Hydratase n=1 Tax=Pigmentiphaga soli TaxID=1007095 RepID=A0ABP8GCG8_9BURK
MSIEFEHHGDGVHVVTLNRPERLNAMDVAHKRRLAEIWREAEQSPQVRALVLRGAGPRAFSAGSDFKEMRETGHNATTEDLANAIPGVGVDFSKPLVAALHGYVIGFGFTLAIHCDLRVGSPQVQMSFPEVQHGMLSAISDVTLPGIVGEAAALEIMLTGRSYGAQEARALRLLNDVADDPFARALELAAAMAANSMSANRLTKQLVLAERRERLLRHMDRIAASRADAGASRHYAAIVAGEPGAGRARL